MTNTSNNVSRRKFLGLTAAAAASFAFLPSSFGSGTGSDQAKDKKKKKAGKPNSKFGGVQKEPSRIAGEACRQQLKTL
ncbi:MAG: twin-arginine translocation signal domain-containing protein [Bacteroidales bacterium]